MRPITRRKTSSQSPKTVVKKLATKNFMVLVNLRFEKGKFLRPETNSKVFWVSCVTHDYIEILASQMAANAADFTDFVKERIANKLNELLKYVWNEGSLGLKQGFSNYGSRLRLGSHNVTLRWRNKFETKAVYIRSKSFCNLHKKLKSNTISVER